MQRTVMGRYTLLICLALLLLGGAEARVSWVVGDPEGEARVPRDVGSAAGGARIDSLTITSEINFRYARTTIVSAITNDETAAKQVSFGTTLPATAFISAFHIDVGGHRHVGEVKPKEEAQRIYEKARNAGKTAAKVDLTARNSNLFTVSVNVEARALVIFNLTYDELLIRRLGGYEHVVHIDPGQIVDDFRVTVFIEESNKLQDLSVEPLLPLDPAAGAGDEYDAEPLPTLLRPTATSATVEWSPTPDQQRALHADGVEGRFVVSYDLDRESNPNQILVHDGYFVHFYAPSDLTPLDKHVVFVLDTSGSMGGTRIQQLKEAMTKILSDLRRGDFFSILEFNSAIKAWRSPGSVQLRLNDNVGADLVVKATPEKIQEAKQFVLGLSAGGGTNIHDSLVLALKIVAAGADKFASLAKRPDPMIIFLTDGDPNEGAVTGKPEIAVAVAAANAAHTSVFTLGFGAGIDMAFLRDLSLKNAAFARLIYEGSDAAVQLEDFYREVSSPLLKDLKFRYTNVDAGTVTRAGFNTLHSGTELIMAGKLAPSAHASRRLRATLNAQARAGRYSTGFAPPEPIRVARADFMERLWAYLNIRQLLEDPSNAQNQRKAQEMALKYSFVTPLTSLVVVRPDVVDPSTALVPEFDERIAGDDSTESADGDEYVIIEPEINTQAPDPQIDTRGNGPLGLSVPEPSVSWDASVFNGTHVTVTKGKKAKTYKIKTKPPSTNFAECRGKQAGTWHHCQHLNACILPVFADDFLAYQKTYFCAIPGNFAGVCCPNSS